MSREVIEKAYDPTGLERRWYSFWERENYFAADHASPKPKFSIVIPPPNVTGSLHMGHALQHTLHDILVRWKRMQGYNVLWLPGTDHASIAVHYVLDKQLEAEGKSRFDLGREQFLSLAWKWKAESGGIILNQMRRLGVSCDWSRERFTMDEGLSNAVKEVFVRLYEEGLIYRGEYIVNWCPRCKTAISDLEVAYRQVLGKLWFIRYPIIGSSQHLVLATTRPETMLGDTAVAVHPEDDRYRNLIGGQVQLPLMDRPIPIIGDSFVDRDFATGIVKITPAHDPHDYEVALRHELPRVTVIDESGRMTPGAGAFAGLDRFECRRRIVDQLASESLLAKTEEYLHNVGHCDRCASAIEPKVSLQWYLKVESLAKPAIAAVESGTVRFVPDSFKNRYFEWMYNIHDWCISRQLWWGHQIPAWFCDACGDVLVQRDKPEACPKCKGCLREETDILDTWFSSALWPFSTLGWPEETPDLKTFYPTDVLITGPDIIFFWVARMIMMGLKYMGDVPFHQVHINGIVRDANRQKMSKTKGNIIEPLQLVEEYGADAVRFTLSSMAVPGTDIPFSTDRMKGYSAFANKVWNAARFVLMNLDGSESHVSAEGIDELLRQKALSLPLEDIWILHRLDEVARGISDSLEKFRFHEASSLIYQFFWHEFCDWYIELIKPVLTTKEDPAGPRAERISILLHAMDYSLRLLHPFMPFITEEIWQKMPHSGRSLMVQEFPSARTIRSNPDAARAMQVLFDLVLAVRSARTEMNLDPRAELDARLTVAEPAMRATVEESLDRVRALARLRSVAIAEALPETSEDVFVLCGIWTQGEFALNLAGAIDVGAQRRRLEKERDSLAAEIEKILRKVNNHEFRSRAPQEVVEENRRRHAELLERMGRLEGLLAQFPGADSGE